MSIVISPELRCPKCGGEAETGTDPTWASNDTVVAGLYCCNCEDETGTLVYVLGDIWSN